MNAVFLHGKLQRVSVSTEGHDLRFAKIEPQCFLAGYRNNCVQRVIRTVQLPPLQTPTDHCAYDAGSDNQRVAPFKMSFPPQFQSCMHRLPQTRNTIPDRWISTRYSDLSQV